MGEDDEDAKINNIKEFNWRGYVKDMSTCVQLKFAP
jgi:hypothetical protein